MIQANEQRPQDPFEAVSYDLNKFRERRVSERRLQLRTTPDRRAPVGVAQVDSTKARGPHF